MYGGASHAADVQLASRKPFRGFSRILRMNADTAKEKKKRDQQTSRSAFAISASRRHRSAKSARFRQDPR
jgi:hypothetical protein